MSFFTAGIQAKNEGNNRNKEISAAPTSSAILKYERKLSEYRDILENYKSFLIEQKSKTEGQNLSSMDSQLTIIQTALDLTYIKEQSDKTVEILEDMKVSQENKIILQLDSLMEAIAQTNFKMEGLDKSIDKDVVNRVYQLLFEFNKQTLNQNHQLRTEVQEKMIQIDKKHKKMSTFLWLLMIFQLIGLGGIIFLVLYLTEFIYI
ncbi:MAG: hypothetical protein K0S47_2329 [Herbinix sp.]|jgi:glutamine synthetase type III|nr:hypothetical protein [Herbinix sp.]